MGLNPQIMLTGIEANHMLAEQSAAFTRINLDFDREFHTDIAILGINGANHDYMRELWGTALNMKTLWSQLEPVVDQTRDLIHSWQVGQSIPLYRTMQRLVSYQIGTISAHTPPNKEE